MLSVNLHELSKGKRSHTFASTALHHFEILKSQIETLCKCFDDQVTQIATLGKPFESIEAVENPNSPKIVIDNNGYAMYFSRSIIPFIRGVEKNEWLLLGIQ